MVRPATRRATIVLLCVGWTTTIYVGKACADTPAPGGTERRGSGSEQDVLLGQRAAHPLSALIGLPNAAARQAGAPLKLTVDYGNAFMGGRDALDTLVLDGETLRLSARSLRRIDDCWSLGTVVGLVGHHGGHFDAAIERWHEVFGLPNAGRDDAARDELRFAYERVGSEGPMALVSATAGIADTQLWLQRTIGCDVQHPDGQTIVRAGIKLPTGRLRDWSGSGATDIWADWQSAVYQPLADLRIGASIGLLATGQTARLTALRPLVAFGALGLRYRVGSRLALHAAIDWNTALFDSELAELGKPAASLATGFSFASGPRSRIDVQILEDVLIDTASDIAMRLTLTLDP